MKILNNLLPFFVLTIFTLLSFPLKGQSSQTQFYIPYWDKAYKIDAALTINQVERLKKIEQDFGLNSHDIRQQQLFWEEERDLLIGEETQKLRLQLAVVSDDQIAIAKKFVKKYENQKEKIEDSIPVGSENEVYARAPKYENYDWVTGLSETQMVLDNYYLSERAIIRNKLEEILTKSEKTIINNLRALNKPYMQEWYSKFNENRKNFSSYEEGLSALNHMVFENMMIETVIVPFLKSNPENYYAAKELAVKYDAQIDELNKEVLGLNYSTFQKFNPITPDNVEMPSWEYYSLYAKNTPDEIEINRNVLFLLWGEAEEIGIHSNRAIHGLTLYPIPAVNNQTLLFELANESKVTIDIIGADGKVLKEVFSGNLEAGFQQRDVDIQDIHSSIFFYRVANEEGISIVKSLKLH